MPDPSGRSSPTPADIEEAKQAIRHLTSLTSRSHGKLALRFAKEGRYDAAETTCKEEMRRLQGVYIENIEKGGEDDIHTFHDVIFMSFTLAEVWSMKNNHDEEQKKLIRDLEKMLTKKLSRSLN